MRSVGFLVSALVALAVLGPMLAPHDPTAINIAARLSPPSGEWWLGTDAFGRDILSRLLHGARWSLGLAFVISLIGLIIGTVAGLTAALGGKAVDWAVMRVTDSFWRFPELVAAVVVIAGILGGGINSLILALSLTSWMRYARVARGVGLSLRTRGYACAGKTRRAVAARHRTLALPAIAAAVSHRGVDGDVRARHSGHLGSWLFGVWRTASDGGMGHDAAGCADPYARRTLADDLAGACRCGLCSGHQLGWRRAARCFGRERLATMSLADRPTWGISLRILSGILGAGMYISVKAVSENVPLGEIVFFRSFFAIIPLILFLWIRNEFPSVLATKRPFGHFLRASFGALALFTSFAALARLSLAEAILIAQLAPMLTAIAAVFFLSERLTFFRRWAGLALVLRVSLCWFGQNWVAMMQMARV